MAKLKKIDTFVEHTQTIEDVVAHVTLKKVKLGFGHDRNGFMCDFYLDGKKMGEFHDDGWVVK